MHHTYLEEKYVQEAEALAAEKPKFMKKVIRGFEEGKGPADVNKPENYQQKFRTYIEDAFYEADENPRRFPHLVENFF